jgi:uncharacterized protein YndB with AHSA1/START domain
MTARASDPAVAEREIVISRSIEGPQRLVFEAFSEARHLAHWFGPNGFTITTTAFEFRLGGVWEFVMHGPDGTDYPNWVQWLEITPPGRLVFLHGERAGDPGAFESTITLVAQGVTTDITMRALFKTKAQRDEVVEKFGAIEGGKQTLGRLAAYIATLSKGGL